MDSHVWPKISECGCTYTHIACTSVHIRCICCSCWTKKKKTSLQIFVRSVEVQEKETVGGTAGSRETLPGGVELTPTHGQVHIPMSTKAAEMCLHATPTVSRDASNDHHMLTSCLLPAQEHMEPTDEQNQGELLQQNYERVQVSWVEGFMK